MIPVNTAPDSGPLTGSNTTYPVQPCPDTPNCHIEEVAIPENPALLFDRLVECLHKTGAESVTPEPDELFVSAVYKIPLLGFRDDVTVRVVPAGNGESVLFIRSASRVGHSDLGVNQRRVKRILRKLKTL
ncbi:MAG: DUF1499 domain-containing protein [Cyclonatronaceae bacterium]